MKKYWVFLKAGWQDTLEYRGDMVVYALSGAVAPLMGMAIWLTVSSSGVTLNYSQTELILYFLAATWVSQITSSWGCWFVNEHINSGTFSRYLVKPFSMLAEFALNNLSEKILKMVVISLIVILFGSLLLKNTSLTAISLYSFILFFPALVMAAIIAFLLDMVIGLTAFWFHDVDFLNSILSTFNQFLSGRIIPLSFFPKYLFGIVIFLPFRYMVSFPIEVLLGKVVGYDLMLGFSIQIGWLILLIIAYKIMYSIGSKSYQGYGA